jgi:hypothetical protein
MGTYNREYKSIQFTIYTSEVRGGWSWSCHLGKDVYFELRERPLPVEELAISEAEHQAQFRIDGV